MSRQKFENQAISGKIGSNGQKLIRPRNDKNVRPGDRMGLDTEQVRQYIKRQKKCKGELFSLDTGDNPGLQVNLAGSARIWLGFALQVTEFTGGTSDPKGNLTVMINNEKVIDDVFIEFFSSGFTDEEYYFMPRPLSGRDDIEFIVNGVEAKYTLNVINYYL